MKLLRWRSIYLSTALPILMAMYPYVFYCSQNITRINSTEFVKVTIVILTLVGLLSWLLHRILKSDTKTALSGFIFSLVFFSYGHLCNLLVGNDQFFANRHWISLVFFMLIILSIFKILKDPEPSESLIRFLIWIMVILTGISSLSIGRKVIMEVAARIEYKYALQMSIENHQALAPDIYLLLVDGYGRQDQLAERGIDNSSFIQSLRQLGFVVDDCSSSNYIRTVQSLSSMLNLNYLVPLQGDISHLPNDLDYNQVDEKLIHSEFRWMVENQGYTTYAFETGYSALNMEDADVYYPLPFKWQLSDYFINSFLSTTMVSALYTSSGPSNIGQISSSSLIDAGVSPEYFYQIKMNALDHLEKIPKGPGPKFVYAHLLNVHEPFVMNDRGEYIGHLPFNNESLQLQIEYTNMRIVRIIEEIQNSSPTQPIILVLSDHGVRTPEDFGFRNFSAIYGPSGLMKQLYSGMTPINIFRAVVNTVFNQGLPILPDYQFRSTENEAGEFELFTNSCPSN